NRPNIGFSFFTFDNTQLIGGEIRDKIRTLRGNQYLSSQSCLFDRFAQYGEYTGIEGQLRFVNGNQTARRLLIQGDKKSQQPDSAVRLLSQIEPGVVTIPDIVFQLRY